MFKLRDIPRDLLLRRTRSVPELGVARGGRKSIWGLRNADQLRDGVVGVGMRGGREDKPMPGRIVRAGYSIAKA
eukprot:498666-Rhodomonas_salina.1